MTAFESGDKDGIRKMIATMGPNLVDQQIRQAISFCWMGMPADRQNPQDVSTEIRRIVERALQDFTSDAAALGDLLASTLSTRKAGT